MNLLWVSAKAPWPPRDGGRLLVAETTQALAGRGHAIHVLAARGPGEPLAAAPDAIAAAGGSLEAIDESPRSWPAAALASAVSGRAVTFERHHHRALGAAVARRWSGTALDAVVVEQPQLFEACRTHLEARLPVVVRAQNVETDLWLGLASITGLGGAWLRREARRVEKSERQVLFSAALTIALTSTDALRLQAIDRDTARIEVIAAPFPARLPPAEATLSGRPAVVLIGATGWAPNQDGLRWFSRDAWPRIAAASSGAELHVFTGPRGMPGVHHERVTLHPPPAESREAFTPGGILVVPLRVASGVRMKILEAWARGIPVVASRAAVTGLDVEHGRELLIAESAPDFAAAIAELSRSPERRASLVAAGRAYLARHHDPSAIAARWEALLTEVVRRRSA